MTRDWIKALSNYSTTRERILEHRFIADVCSQLWVDGEFDLSVSHSEVDNAGYDLILEARGFIRHNQLKALHLHGRARNLPIQQRLQDKDSGCVVLIRHDARTLEVARYEFYGGDPGARLPCLGDKLARHTKGDSTGFKAERPALRLLAKSEFVEMPTVAALTGRLFGTPRPSVPDLPR